MGQTEVQVRRVLMVLHHILVITVTGSLAAQIPESRLVVKKEILVRMERTEALVRRALVM